MRSKLLYALLVFGVVVLVIAAVFLTRNLLDLNNQAAPSPAASTAQASSTDALQAETPPASAQTLPPAVQPAATEDPAPPAVTKALPLRNSPPARENATPPAKTAVAQEGIGSVTLSVGKVFLTAPTGKRREAAVNARVLLNDNIETAASAKARIKFDDGSNLSLGENTVIILDEYIYDPAKPKDSGFAMRNLKGISRLITGLIVSANPDRFKVRTKMASVGIRGCDLAFRSTADRDDIYVLEMGKEDGVVVATTSDGAQLMNMLTGQELSVDESKKKSFSVRESQTAVTVVKGKGSDQRRVGPDEIRALIADTSYRQPAEYDVQQGPDGAVMTIKPANRVKEEPVRNK